MDFIYANDYGTWSFRIIIQPVGLYWCKYIINISVIKDAVSPMAQKQERSYYPTTHAKQLPQELMQPYNAG